MGFVSVNDVHVWHHATNVFQITQLHALLGPGLPDAPHKHWRRALRL